MPVLGWCWLYIFSVLSSYYIMRPIRDEAGVAGGVNNLQWLFTGTLLGMVLLNIPFAFLVKKLPRRRFIPITYHFFAINIVLFAALLHWADAQQTVWIGRIFFIWVSVYNLFVVSVFWQMNVDLFSPEQSKRLFGLIAAGATIGAIVGSSVTAAPGAACLADFSAVRRRGAARNRGVQRRPTVAPVAGVASRAGGARRPTKRRSAAASLPASPAPSARATSSMSAFSCCCSRLPRRSSTFSRPGSSATALADRGAQTAFFATIDLLVNILTLAIQLFLTGRILVLLGVALDPGLLPVLTIIGFSALALMPTIAAVAVFQVLRRAGDYAITRPTREVLFTVVPREDRYKAKSFIDTVVYRAGDQIGAWSVALWRGAGLGTAEMALVALPLAGVVARQRAVARPSAGKHGQRASRLDEAHAPIRQSVRVAGRRASR